MVRQNIHIRRVILILVVLSGCNLATAQNLVPNSGFEEFDDCPDLPGQIGEAIGWFNVGGGCDYYNVCGSNGFSIPVNYSGGGYARTGDAYAQISVYAVSIINGREFAGVELTESLQANVNYRIEFYLSMMDSLNYAVRNVAAHLSAQPHPQNLSALLSLEPQVRYDGETFLDDKLRWMKVSGAFTAQGGERYMAIGNFDHDANTDTIFVAYGGNPNGHPSGYWDAAGYFIDDVSVIPDSIYLSNEELGVRSDELEIYPNPATDAVTVETDRWRDMGLDLYDATGRQVLQHAFGSSRESISVGHLPRGVYVAVLQENGVVIERSRLILQ